MEKMPKMTIRLLDFFKNGLDEFAFIILVLIDLIRFDRIELEKH